MWEQDFDLQLDLAWGALLRLPALASQLGIALWCDDELNAALLDGARRPAAVAAMVPPLPPD